MGSRKVCLGNEGYRKANPQDKCGDCSDRNECDKIIKRRKEPILERKQS